jgi:hypothetical protein
MRFPNLPSDELAMLATVEAASNAGQYTVIPEPQRTKDQRKRLAALRVLVSKGWIQGLLDFDMPAHLFYTEKAKVFKATRI